MEQLFRKFFTWNINYWNILTRRDTGSSFSTVIYLCQNDRNILTRTELKIFGVMSLFTGQLERERVELPLVFASLFVKIYRTGGGGGHQLWQFAPKIKQLLCSGERRDWGTEVSWQLDLFVSPLPPLTAALRETSLDHVAECLHLEPL